jgi:hypothetical protein
MTQVGAQRFEVDAGRDQVASRRMATLVELYSLEPCGLPGVVSMPDSRSLIEGHRGCLAEDQPLRAPAAELVLNQVLTQDYCDRHPAPAALGLRGDETGLTVPGPLDADDPRAQVYVLLLQSLKLPAPKARVKRRGP